MSDSLDFADFISVGRLFRGVLRLILALHIVLPVIAETLLYRTDKPCVDIDVHMETMLKLLGRLQWYGKAWFPYRHKRRGRDLVISRITDGHAKLRN